MIMVELSNLLNDSFRTYVDAVINHMSGLGRLGVSYAGSPYDGDAHDFPGYHTNFFSFNEFL